MTDRDILRNDRLDRVQTFGRTNAGDFAPGGKATTLFTRLDQLLDHLGLAKIGQLRTPTTKSTLLDALWLDLKLIAGTSRSAALDDPAWPAGSYRLPEDRTETLIRTHADAILALLEDKTTDTPAELAAKAARRAEFLAYEMESDFVADLRADRDAIDGANLAKTTDNLEGVESTSAIDTLLAEGQKLVSQLDAIMRNKYKRDPDKLHAWQSASHVERSPRPPKPTPEPPASAQ